MRRLGLGLLGAASALALLATAAAAQTDNWCSGKTIRLFSGGPARSDDDVIEEVRQIHAGGGRGSIVGRNAFQRPRDDALRLLERIIDIHLGKAG